MITQVFITSYKSCHGTSLDAIGPFTVLVGRNGAGKSNILQAIDWAARTATSAIPQRSIPYDDSSVQIDFRCGGTLNRYIVQLKWVLPSSQGKGAETAFEESWLQEIDGVWVEQVSRRNDAITISGRIDEIKVQPTTPSLPAIASLLPAEDQLISRLTPVLSFLSSVHYYPMDESVATKRDSFFEVVNETAYATWLSDYALGRLRDDVLLKILHLQLTDRDRFDEFTNLLGSNGLGIIDDIHIDKIPYPQSKSKDSPNHFYVIGFIPSSGISSALPRQVISFGDLSHGTRRIMRIVLAVFFDQSSVMLLEHPEDGIHPGLLIKLMGALKAYCDPLQTIAASHSPEVFNAVAPEDIRLVSMADGETALRKLSEIEVDSAKKYICVDGPFSDFLESIQGS